MKKVLFATSALVASTGFAAADVSISGYAEMGIVGGSDGAETQFHQDIDVTFSMSGTTDNGLTFGAAVDLDEAAVDSCSNNVGTSEVSANAALGAAAGSGTNTAVITDDGATDDYIAVTTACTENAMGATGAHGGVAVFISGAMGTLTLGDTDGGFDWGMSEVPTGSGSIADNETGHSGFNGNSGLDGTNDGQILRYNHSVGGLGFAVSIELDDATATDDTVVGLGLRYSMGDLGIGLGYQTSDDYDIAGVSLSYSMGDLAFGLNYSSLSKDGDPDDQNHMGIGMSYSMDAITIGMNYGSYDNYGHVAGADRAGFGMSAGYDLGGGASILLGYETTTDHEAGAASENSTWSLGLAMSF
jgi:outer membrane protein OmpU